MLRCQFVTAGDLGNHRPTRHSLGNDPSLVLVPPTPPTAHAHANLNTAASSFDYIFDHICKTIPPNQQPSFRASVSRQQGVVVKSLSVIRRSTQAARLLSAIMDPRTPFADARIQTRAPATQGSSPSAMTQNVRNAWAVLARGEVTARRQQH